MSLYPSLEDMTVHKYETAQHAAAQAYSRASEQPVYDGHGVLPPSQTGIPAGVDAVVRAYPNILDEYMGLRLEPPSGYPSGHFAQPQSAVVAPSAGTISAIQGGGQVVQGQSLMVAPLTSQSLGLARANVTHGVREVVLCKDGNGKVGMRLRAVDKGVFVQFVGVSSPAALGGIRFGDQILQIDGKDVVGMDQDKAMDLIKKCRDPKRIIVIVRDRPFERTITLHKDSSGHLGFEHKDNEIRAIAKDTSAARNGLLINHHILEINGQNVIGLKNKDVSKVIEQAGKTVTLTVMPSQLYDHMIKRMDFSLITKKQDHSIPEV